MSTHNIPILIIKREHQPKLSQICSYGIFSTGLKNEFKTAIVNERSVFEPLKGYPTFDLSKFYAYMHTCGLNDLRIWKASNFRKYCSNSRTNTCSIHEKELKQ